MIPRRKTPRPKALWTRIWPDTVERTSKQHTAVERTAYRKEARAFVKAAIARGETCPVVAAIPELRDGTRYGHPISGRLNEVHHTHGRTGKLLRHQQWWMAVSKAGHRWIHAHIAEARKHGWICQPGQWNKPPKDLSK